MASKSTKQSKSTKARPQATQSSPVNWLPILAKTAEAKAAQLRQQAGAAR